MDEQNNYNRTKCGSEFRLEVDYHPGLVQARVLLAPTVILSSMCHDVLFCFVYVWFYGNEWCCNVIVQKGKHQNVI